MGPQEGNTVAMAKPVTKYAVTVKNPRRIRYELECAFHHATSGRPGPVVLELPAPCSVRTDRRDGSRTRTPNRAAAPELASKLSADVAAVIEAIRGAEAAALRRGKRDPLFEFARAPVIQSSDRTRIPVVLPLTAKDLVHESHPLQMGVFGPSGQRRANSRCRTAIA